MIVVDVNLLLYAYDSASPQHEYAKSWWEQQLSSADLVALPWMTILGFLRITTNSRIFDQPFSIQESMDHVESWIDRKSVKILHPTERHWDVLQQLLAKTNGVANHVPDAHLAALAIEHGALLCSTDQDFARYAELSWVNPLQ